MSAPIALLWGLAADELPDGPGLCAGLIRRMPLPRGPVIDRAGRAGWQTMTRYARGTLIIAAIDVTRSLLADTRPATLSAPERNLAEPSP